MTTLRSRIVCFVVLGALTSAPACLFDTRPAQDPKTDNCPVVVLDTPEQVFLAVEKSLEECRKDANYESAVSATFVFSPTIIDSLDQTFVDTGVFDNWNETVEIATVDALLADSKKVDVTFTATALINKVSFVRYRVNYTLDVITKAAPDDTTHYAGVANFDVRNEGGNWRLTFWDEVETVAGHSTWGFLKGILRLRTGV